LERLYDSGLNEKEQIADILSSRFNRKYSHSKQQKYLKYKNKYLQLKRLENNSKYSS
jgi:hypothetical protein